MVKQKFDYGVYLTQESVFILIYNVALLLMAIFFKYDLLEMLAVILLEGVIITLFYCLAVMLFPKIIIKNFKRVVRDVNWESPVNRGLNVLKVLLISFLGLAVFFCIDFGIVSIFSNASFDLAFFASTGFFVIVGVIVFWTLVDLIFACAPFSRKVIGLSYSRITASAGIFVIYFILFVIIFMLFSWILWIAPNIRDYLSLLFLFLFILAKYLISVEVANEDYFLSQEDNED